MKKAPALLLGLAMLFSLTACGSGTGSSDLPQEAAASEEQRYQQYVAMTPEEIVAGMTSEKTEYHIICNRIEAIHWALDNADSGDVILLAGKGHEDYQVVGHEKYHMDEREIIAEYLKEKDRL